MLLLALTMVMSISAQAPYEVAIEQSNAEAVKLSVQANELWGPTSALFSSINQALTNTVSNFTVVYNTTSASAAAFVNATYANGNCPVGTPLDYFQNATRTLDFLCCHTQKLRSPGLLTTYSQMYSSYFNTSGGMNDPTATLLDYIEEITNSATIGIVHRDCVDDKSIVDAQTPIAIALAAAPAAGILLQTYQDLIFNVKTLFTCVQGLSPLCLINGTLTTAQAKVPALDFPDVGFDFICGQETLATFDLSRFTTPCQPPNVAFL